MEAVENLHSWHQAFEEHSVASTRAIEKQLRASIANDKGKLRGLVGNNYRELLASAEQIVLLGIQTKNAETHISGLGQKCQPSAPQHREDAGSRQRRLIVQLRLLQNCVSEARAALRRADVLQCSQVIVIARLLAKSLSDEEVPVVAPLRDKVASLRRSLLSLTDTKLASPLTEPLQMLSACCAYCLVTSSSSLDALKHVQRVRLDKLRNLLSSGSLSQQSLIDVLRYHLDSLQTLKGLAGRAMIEALGNLQKRPVLQDQSLGSLELLELRNLETLLPEEIRSFMPYFKRTQLMPQETRQMLETWSDEACQIFSSGLQHHLDGLRSCSDLILLRQKLYMVFLPVYFSTPGQRHLHKTLRTGFEGRMTEKITGLEHTLTGIGLGLKELDSDSNTVGFLWQPELSQMPLTNGGKTFLQQVRRRRLGRTGRQVKLSRMIDDWILSVRKMHEELIELRRNRWRDRLEEPDDEQEDEAEQIVNELTQKDPDSYLGHLQRSVTAALATYESTLSDAVITLVNQKHDGLTAIPLLRAIRDSLGPLQKAFANEYKFEKLQHVLPQLHGLVGAEVIARLSGSESTAIPLSSNEGNGLPSPRTFAFLRRLCAVMLEVGSTDVWSQGAVRAVKEAVASHIFQEDRRKHYVESAFDDGYLRIALQQPLPKEEALAGSQSKDAEEYWSRTRLLFGILVQ